MRPILNTTPQHRLILGQLSRDGVAVIIYLILVNKVEGRPKYNGSVTDQLGSKGNKCTPLKVQAKGCTGSLKNLLDLVLPPHLELCALVIFWA